MANSDEYFQCFIEQTGRVLSEASIERRQIRSEIRLHWRPALRRLEANLCLAHHLGREFNNTEREARRFGAIRHALFMLHANACLVGSEIMILLQTGHANGAEARWRSLHEIAVFSEFIRKEGDGVAKRYLDHHIIKAWEDANAWQDQAGPAERFSDETMTGLGEDVAALKQKYGEAYLGGYGWASEALRVRNPEAKGSSISFQQLEKAVDFSALMRGRYRQASHAVHPTSKGMHFNLTSPPSRVHLPSAPSRHGIFHSGWNTCQSIFLVTASLLSIDLDEHRRNALKTLAKLTRLGLHQFVVCHRRLESTEEADGDC